jgi:hypothetical protein
MFNINRFGYVSTGTTWFDNGLRVSDLWIVECVDGATLRTYTFTVCGSLFYAVESFGYTHTYENWYTVYMLTDEGRAIGLVQQDGAYKSVGLGRIKATTKKLLNTIVE